METPNITACIDRFKNGSNCAQAVLSTYALAMDCDRNFAHRLGAGLGGGVGRKQYLCGAVAAGAMVLSARYGNNEPSNQQAKELALAKVRGLVDTFEEAIGSSQCLEIIQTDISTPEGRKQASENGIFETLCTDCLKKVCTFLDTDFRNSEVI
jgi:C_GCAxxG_C_C family probable redox protein